MGSCPTQAVLPLVGLAAEKVIRDRYNCLIEGVRGRDHAVAKWGGRETWNIRCRPSLENLAATQVSLSRGPPRRVDSGQHLQFLVKGVGDA
ncbi:MAG: hypothetical protein R6U98_36915 [Pirellulaceae bacterium]